MTGNQTKYKTLNKVAKHPAVRLIEDEGDDGIWVYLNDGWFWEGCTSIHQYKVNEIIVELRNVKYSP